MLINTLQYFAGCLFLMYFCNKNTNMRYYNPNSSVVERDHDVIYIRKLNHSRVVSEFIKAINDGQKKGYDDFQINFSEIDAAFPNAVTPIAGILEHLKENSISFDFDGTPQIIIQNKMLKPAFYIKSPQSETNRILNKVWKFSTSDDVAKLVDTYIDELQKCDRFHKGMLDSVEWALNEVMDNVIQHSDSSHGYVMGQLHTNRKYIAFTIFDTGQGIYNSLRQSVHAPRNTIDAITLAIKEEVTRDKKIGQGNGLYGLHSIIKQGKRRLVITSGTGSYMYNNGDVKTFDRIPQLSKISPCTIVDFQLDYSVDLSLDKALVFRGKQYNIINLRIENLEDEQGNIVYKIKEHAEGTGTREAAIRVKNEIFNILQTKPKIIILDFEGVAVVSSSFADELIAKLLLELGLFQFNNIIRLKGLDNSQQNILQRSVIQRLLEEFNHK